MEFTHTYLKKFSLKQKKTYFKHTQFEKPCSKPIIIIMQANMFKNSVLKQKHTTKCMPTNLKKFLFHFIKKKNWTLIQKIEWGRKNEKTKPQIFESNAKNNLKF